MPGAGGGDLGGLLVNRLEVDPASEDELARWYDQEHLPALCRVEGCLGARRFVATEGGQRHMVIYYLTDPAVQASPEWRRAADTPWTVRMRAVMRQRWRVVYRPAP